MTIEASIGNVLAFFGLCTVMGTGLGMIYFGFMIFYSMANDLFK